MKKQSICILVNLLFVGVLTVSNGMALSDPPNMRVSVANTDESNIYLVGSPVNMVVILENMNDDQSIMPFAGFSTQDFRLMLDFAFEDGTVIKANDRDSIIFRNNREVPLADMLSLDGQFIPVEAVEKLEPRWWWKGEFEANQLYSLARPGKISVSAKVPIRSYDAVLLGTDNKAKLCDDEERTDCYAGMLESVAIPICVTADLDGDGYYFPCVPDGSVNDVLDCDDQDPAVNPEAFEITNNNKDDDCNPDTADLINYSIMQVHADKHVVGTGDHPGAGKTSLSNMEVNIYDRSAGTCAADYSASWQDYSAIWASCLTPEEGLIDSAVTDLQGEVTFQVPQDGSYILLGKFDPDPAVADDEMFIGRVQDNLAAEETVYMQIIEKADGKKVPAKNTKRTGSLLMIIQPEYVEWSGTEELYPFVFESIGDWDVSTSVDPPEGFVADQESLTENVDMELEAVQFTIVDVGSEWVDTGVTFDVEHKGKKEKIKEKIGIKCAKELAKEKGFDEFCKVKKVKLKK